MARVTVEDCLDYVDNRFELVLLASKRARELGRGEEAQVKWEKDKATVVALREIAEGLITPKYYEEKQKKVSEDIDEVFVKEESDSSDE